MSKQFKITYVVESTVTLSDEAVASVLADYKVARAGHPDAPTGFINAAQKLNNDADDDLILRTVLGEVTSLIISNEVPGFYPPAPYFEPRFSKVAYQETPEKLDPPESAVPLILVVGSNTVQ